MENSSTEKTGEVLGKDLTNLKKDVAQIAADVKQHGRAHVEATKELINEKIKLAREAAAARPLAIFGVGFLIGFLFALRCRR
jgi:hypothetical protein